VTLARALPDPQVTLGGWTLTRVSMSFGQQFSVHIRVTRKIASAVLTYDIRGVLGNFTSSGVLHIRDSHLTHSRMGGGGLAGQLTAQWSLSAPVSLVGAILPSLDVDVPLFRWPLLIGDFPIYLAVEARLHLAPVFDQYAQILGGRVDIGFSGSQGLRFDDQSLSGDAGLNHSNHSSPEISGQPFTLSALDLGATFPYLEVGDDINDPLTGALVWTGLTLDTQTRSGTDPGLCLRTDAVVHADAGVTAWLFGLHAGVSTRLFADNIGSLSLPPNPLCAPA